MLTTLLVGAGGGAVSLALARWARRIEAVDRARALPARARHLPAAIRAPLARALDAAALDVTPEAAVQLWGLGAVCVVIVAAAVSPAFAVVGAAGAFGGAPVGLRMARHRRARLVAAAVPGMLETIAAELRSGATVASALLGGAGAGAGADAEGPLAGDLAMLRARVALGATVADALAAWARERNDVPGVPAAAGALALASVAGGRASDALDGLAASLRARLGVVAEARALSSQARLSAFVVGGAPLAYLAFSAAVDRSSVGVLTGTPVGLACLAVGLLLEGLAALWMRRITSEES